jgi:hypothetical protein
MLSERRHNFFGEQAHGFEDFLMRDAAVIERRRKRVEIVVSGGVVNSLNHLAGIAIIISPRS